MLKDLLVLITEVEEADLVEETETEIIEVLVTAEDNATYIVHYRITGDLT